MHLSIKYGFAFLCVPKCASSSIESVLDPFSEVRFGGNPHLKHMNAKELNTVILSHIQSKIPDTKVEIFCVMRNPTDWVFSWYRFRKRDVLKNPNHPGAANYTGNITFNEFVSAYLNKDNRPSFADITTQRNFFLMPDTSLGVDYVFSMDRLDMVEEFISKKIGREIKLPVRNVSAESSYTLDKNLEERLYDFLRLDYDIFKQVSISGVLRKDERN
ncbi:MAG: sulfotransferase family 2 domain-containing protein [Halieaceae bacterium]